jgi:hypothetical protein
LTVVPSRIARTVPDATVAVVPSATGVRWLVVVNRVAVSADALAPVRPSAAAMAAAVPTKNARMRTAMVLSASARDPPDVESSPTF